ncbi:hypothetical protein AgCh_022716 [Apium graveolens]
MQVEIGCAVLRVNADQAGISIGSFYPAVVAIPNSEETWLAAFKLEFDKLEFERARTLLAKATGETEVTACVHMKSAIVEWELANISEQRRLLDEGLKYFPTFSRPWLMLGHLEYRLNRLDQGKEVALLTMARIKGPQSPELGHAAVQAESRHDNKKEAEILMAKALQECLNRGTLWASSIEMVPRPQRKTKSSDAPSF